jgi:hypothetical protein
MSFEQYRMALSIRKYRQVEDVFDCLFSRQEFTYAPITEVLLTLDIKRQSRYRTTIQYTYVHQFPGERVSNQARDSKVALCSASCNTLLLGPRFAIAHKKTIMNNEQPNLLGSA